MTVGLAGIAVVGETRRSVIVWGLPIHGGQAFHESRLNRNTIEASGPYGILSILSGRMGLFAVKKILVTGSAGVIGRALVKDLVRQGMVVGGLDREQAEKFTGAAVNYACDILDRARLTACVSEFAPDAIVHLAARTDFDGKDVRGYAANIEGVSNLVEAIRATPSVTRCIWTSTQLVCRVGYVPTGPCDYQPDTVYGRSKVHTEEIVRASDGAGREWCLVRPTTVWGPGVNLHYQRFLKLVRRGLFFHVDSGPLYKSYGYIGNITHQYIRLLHAPAEIIHGRTLYLADYSPIDGSAVSTPRSSYSRAVFGL